MPGFQIFLCVSFWYRKCFSLFCILREKKKQFGPPLVKNIKLKRFWIPELQHQIPVRLFWLRKTKNEEFFSVMFLLTVSYTSKCSEENVSWGEQEHTKFYVVLLSTSRFSLL